MMNIRHCREFMRAILADDSAQIIHLVQPNIFRGSPKNSSTSGSVASLTSNTHAEPVPKKVGRGRVLPPPSSRRIALFIIHRVQGESCVSQPQELHQSSKHHTLQPYDEIMSSRQLPPRYLVVGGAPFYRLPKLRAS